MIARAYTVAFEGIDARLVEVQCAVTPGLPAFGIVGLPDKAVSEARSGTLVSVGNERGVTVQADHSKSVPR